MSDLINHPPHYTTHVSGIECVEIAEHMPFNLGNAWKYLFRAGLKGPAESDIKKALFYVRREMARRNATVWKALPADPRYEISTIGEVRNAATGRMRKLVQIKGGYLTFMVRSGGVPTLHYVHRSVMEAHGGPIPTGMEVCHNDGDKLNNRITNLRIDTPTGNSRDKRVAGRVRGGSKIDESIASEIRFMNGAVSPREVARQYGISPAQVRRIWTGEAWGDRRLPEHVLFDKFYAAEPASPKREAMAAIWLASRTDGGTESLLTAESKIEEFAA